MEALAEVLTFGAGQGLSQDAAVVPVAALLATAATEGAYAGVMLMPLVVSA